jgi:hypothetical protein
VQGKRKDKEKLSRTCLPYAGWDIDWHALQAAAQSACLPAGNSIQDTSTARGKK